MHPLQFEFISVPVIGYNYHNGRRTIHKSYCGLERGLRVQLRCVNPFPECGFAGIRDGVCEWAWP